MQHFVYSIRIFTLKKKILTWSRNFIRTNFKKHIFWLATKTICIKMKFLDHVRHNQYFQFLSCSFMTSLLPKYLKKKWCCVLNFNSSSNQNLTHAQNKHQHDYLNLSTCSVLSRICERLSDFECFYSHIRQNGQTHIKKSKRKRSCAGVDTIITANFIVFHLLISLGINISLLKSDAFESLWRTHAWQT